MKRKEDFRVLFIYPNLMMMPLPPTSIALLTAVLRQAGFSVELFDTTLYRTEEVSSDDKKVENLQVRPFDLGSRGVTYRNSDMVVDLLKRVEEFHPSLIAVSVVEDTWPQAANLLDALSPWKSENQVPVIVGGVFSTFAPEKVMRHPVVDYACRGEGDEALPELCEKLYRGEDVSQIRNLWIRAGEEIIRNPIREGVSMERLPYPDFSIFDPMRMYRPMAGTVYRMVPIETHRGCPYKCAFCNSPQTMRFYRNEADQFYLRLRSIERTIEEIRYLVRRWGLEYIYFTADTFLAMSDAELRKFSDLYKETIGLPFWMQTRPETFSEARVHMLQEMGIHRCSVGIEHGNEEFRRKVVGRNYSNKKAIDVFGLLSRSGIPVTVNNIIGFPDETRELVFDTIRFNKHLDADTLNCCTFVPYHGTPLREVCLQKGYIQEGDITNCLNKDSILRMPQFPPAAIKGLQRAFCIYVKFPEREWPFIEGAETLDNHGNAVFQHWRDRYAKQFFTDPVDDDEARVSSPAVAVA